MFWSASSDTLAVIITLGSCRTLEAGLMHARLANVSWLVISTQWLQLNWSIPVRLTKNNHRDTYQHLHLTVYLIHPSCRLRQHLTSLANNSTVPATSYRLWREASVACQRFNRRGFWETKFKQDASLVTEWRLCELKRLQLSSFPVWLL